MRKPQWALQLILVAFSIIFSNLVSAYGGGGTPRPPCKPAKFKRFKPPASSVVEPKSGFSFIASPNTSPSTIKVSVKRIKVKVDVEKQIDGQFRVNGMLPDSLSKTWAKIKIVGETHNCKRISILVDKNCRSQTNRGRNREYSTGTDRKTGRKQGGFSSTLISAITVLQIQKRRERF